MIELRRKIEILNKELIFIGGTSANLLFHTLNTYNLLMNHGRTYSKRINNNDIPDENLLNFFKSKADNNFSKIVKDFIEINPQSPEEMIKEYEKGDEYEKNLALALKLSWDKFYYNYWENNESRLNTIFGSMIEDNNWENIIKDLEEITGNSFPEVIYLIGSEALAEAAMMLKPNISIGSIREGSDFGFSHEGLHLLLQEKWAEDERIRNLIPNNWNDVGGWGCYWKRKFEQAIVVSLDSLIRKKDESATQNYFKGCNVGELQPFFFEPIKVWYEQKKKNQTKEKLEDVVYRILVENKKDLIDKYINSSL